MKNSDLDFDVITGPSVPQKREPTAPSVALAQPAANTPAPQPSR